MSSTFSANIGRMLPLLFAGALGAAGNGRGQFLAQRGYPTQAFAAPSSSPVLEMRGRAPDVNKTGEEVAQGNDMLQIEAAPAAWNETRADAVGHAGGFFQLSDCGCGSSAGCDCSGEGEATHPERIKWVHRLGTQTADEKKALEGLCKHGKYMATRVLTALSNGFQDGDCVKRLGKYSGLLQYEGDEEDVWLTVFWKENEVVEFYLLPKEYSRQIITSKRNEKGKRQRDATWSNLWETYTRLVEMEKSSRSKWGRLVRTTSVTKPIPAPYSPRGLAFGFQLALTAKLPRTMLEACANLGKGGWAKFFGLFRSKARVAMVKKSCAALPPVLTKAITEYEEFPGGGSRGIFFPGAELSRGGGTKVIRELWYEKEEEGGKGLDADAVSKHGESSVVPTISVVGTAEKSGLTCAYKGPPQLACLFLQDEKGAASLAGAGLSASLVRVSFLQMKFVEALIIIFAIFLICFIGWAFWMAVNGKLGTPAQLEGRS
ncbi:unnamed protein product [Amoebophrya sp. A25]|nr:unnamed protein product [Amoebophrya sp. A25]|eukprot:GSA25T00017204001.1